MSVFAVLAVLGFGAAYIGPLTATETDAHAAELDPVSLYASTIADAQAYLAASEADTEQKQASGLGRDGIVYSVYVTPKPTPTPTPTSTGSLSASGSRSWTAISPPSTAS